VPLSQSERTSPNDVAAGVMLSWGDFCKWRWDRRAKVVDQGLLARDLKFLQPAEYERLTGEVVEVKRMLASSISKLRADR
jgi:hypothetical protein